MQDLNSSTPRAFQKVCGKLTLWDKWAPASMRIWSSLHKCWLKYSGALGCMTWRTVIPDSRPATGQNVPIRGAHFLFVILDFGPENLGHSSPSFSCPLPCPQVAPQEVHAGRIFICHQARICAAEMFGKEIMKVQQDYLFLKWHVRIQS